MNGRVEVDLKIYRKIEDQLIDYPDYIINWYYYLKANGQSAMTCRDYINKMRLFLESINREIKDVTLDQLDEFAITRYFINIQHKEDGSETSDSYRQCVWSCLNNFFDFIEGRKMVKCNLFKSAKIKRPKNKDMERINNGRRLLTQEDFNKILETVNMGAGSKKAKSFQYKYKNRDKCIMLIFMTTGIRKTALEEINIEDIDLDNHTLFVMDKGHKIHEYYLNDKTITAIRDWLDDRKYIMGNTSGALFVSKENKRMCGNSITKVVDKYAYGALGYHISPHKLRSGLVSILYDQTGDIEFCRRAIGHSNVATTQRYIVTNNEEREKTANIMNGLLN